MSAQASPIRLSLLARDRFEPDQAGYVATDGVHRLPVPPGVTPQMRVKAVWFVRAGELGTFEEMTGSAALTREITPDFDVQ
jgi:hypothetical protein